VKQRPSGTSFQAGLVLEKTVSNGLNQLGIDHRRTTHRSREDVQEGLDFIIYPGSGRAPLEVQLTLRAKNYRKIRQFVECSLTTPLRGTRLYIEVVGSHRRADLTEIGCRIAQRIALISQRFRDFGPFNLLGIRIHALTGKIIKFDLIKFCHLHTSRLLQLAHQWLLLRAQAAETKRRERRRSLTCTFGRPEPRRVLSIVYALQMPKSPPNAVRPGISARHFFAPRRFCPSK
jgi:hypothetical protein